MSLASFVESVWTSDATAARMARGVLTPTSWLFERIVAQRNARYDRARPSGALPAISIGNLTVGGTGKTPMAAWCVQRLRALGAKPAIVMRGVGDDEWRVHGVLNPGSPVIVAPDRVAGMLIAKSRGADCAVLDDAFQHRRAARLVDIVLLSADQWTSRVRLLPSGPFREPLSSLARAHLAVITVKAEKSRESDARVDAMLAEIRRVASHIEYAVAHLRPGSLRLAASLLSTGVPDAAGLRGPRADLLTHPPEWLAGKQVVLVSAIGNPDAFERQIRALDAHVRSTRRFPDHHAYTDGDASAIAVMANGADGVVCTLKDAVKLARCWPREAPPLWYLSQSVVVDRGVDALDRACARVLAARTATTPTAG